METTLFSVYMAVDSSGSVVGVSQAALNEGLRLLVTGIQSNETTRSCVDLAIFGFGSEVRQPGHDPTHKSEKCTLTDQFGGACLTRNATLHQANGAKRTAKTTNVLGHVVGTLVACRGSHSPIEYTPKKTMPVWGRPHCTKTVYWSGAVASMAFETTEQK